MVDSTGAGATGAPLDGRRLDDLDPALVELADEGLLLEPRELVRLDDFVHVRGSDRAGLLGGLEQDPQVVLRQQGLDVDSGHGRRGERRPCGS